ncbi:MULTISPECIES: helix-turn-helix domain-containing protein [Paenibacillus]|jgi:DNA-binding Xre family transcriptional regulator|uniref:Control protein n=2 Tax=Paenibacillus TaxID=44249 RepID=A0ABX2ZFG1_PAEPO|nr:MULTISPECIES: helix-turn-helix transcriptional regulator [Paenibacillus]AOK90250.1 control protein [Paenibacillus polymyxa]KAF6579119.1 helix-turn-helix transcriptional regulator [Paenibacillus sp. EKM212P]KYG92676.1 control protein [Paenibacillus polymyxa]MDR6778756.1 DNA-binding Xre family transcriptional regulator [Paenibacillus peoriae]MEC0183649.1 helix-turn-helix transcriptional regulator [Paenibacillus peoriae]
MEIQNRYHFKLGDILEELDISRNKLAVEAKIRPATVIDMVNGKTKRLELETLVHILDALNRFARQRRFTRTITLADIVEYIPEDGIEGH